MKVMISEKLKMSKFIRLTDMILFIILITFHIILQPKFSQICIGKGTQAV